MDIYLILKIIIFFALVLVFIMNIWWVMDTFSKGMERGLATLLAWLIGYVFYLLFKLLENDMASTAKDRLSSYFSSQEGRIILALICLFIGWLIAYLYTSKPLKNRSPLQSAFLLLFLSLVHSALIDSFLSLLKAEKGSFMHILPSISFTLALAMTYIYKLAVKLPFANEGNDSPPETTTPSVSDAPFGNTSQSLEQEESPF